MSSSSASAWKPTSLPSGLKEVLTEPSGLQVRIYYLECLAHASYIVEHDGKAVVIDPRRDVDAYIDELANLKAELKGVMETHFHADFVSGHLELQKRCSVPIYFGPSAASRAKFSLHELQHGEEVSLSSRYVFRVIHTPGHTPESICYLLLDREQENKALKVFTGDTLFIGSCGRPDLVASRGQTPQEMAELMFDSLQNKVMTLPLDVQVFPAHGAGSPCGKNLSTALYSTIGKELATNPALQFSQEQKEEFVAFLTSEPAEVPQYFSYDVTANVEGAPPLSEDVLKVPKVTPLEFMRRSLGDKQFVILDTRNACEFAGAFIPKSLNCPIGSEGGVIVGPEDGNFSIWVGTMILKASKIGLVTPTSREEEALKRLGRIGYSVDCVLSGGIEEWRSAGYPTHSFTKIDLESHPEIMKCLTQCGHQMVDVRTDHEFKANTVQGAINMPLTKLQQMMCELDRALPVVCFCKGGFRSSIAVSLLLKEGFSAQDVQLGFAAISTYSPELTTTGEVCPSMKEVIASAKSSA